MAAFQISKNFLGVSCSGMCVFENVREKKKKKEEEEVDDEFEEEEEEVGDRDEEDEEGDDEDKEVDGIGESKSILPLEIEKEQVMIRASVRK